MWLTSIIRVTLHNVGEPHLISWRLALNWGTGLLPSKREFFVPRGLWSGALVLSCLPLWTETSALCGSGAWHHLIETALLSFLALQLPSSPCRPQDLAASVNVIRWASSLSVSVTPSPSPYLSSYAYITLLLVLWRTLVQQTVRFSGMV